MSRTQTDVERTSIDTTKTLAAPRRFQPPTGLTRALVDDQTPPPIGGLAPPTSAMSPLEFRGRSSPLEQREASQAVDGQRDHEHAKHGEELPA